MSTTSTYDALTPAVRELVDRKVAEAIDLAPAGVTVTDADVRRLREALARRVETRTYRPTHGRGH